MAVTLNYGMPVTDDQPKIGDLSATAVEDETVGTVFNYEAPTEDELNDDSLDEESKLLQEMRPPQVSNEPNYYEKPIKPKKGTKKYNPDEKWINKKKGEEEDDAQEVDFRSDEEKLTPLDYFLANIMFEFFAPLVRNAGENEGKLSLNTGEIAPVAAQSRSDESNDRIEYQVHGQDGPQSYKFGFDTGKG